MAKDVTVTWDLPTAREQGGALDPSDIQHVLVELSADGGASYSELNRVLPTEAQQVFVPDLDVGQWHFRLIVVDTLGQSSAPHVELVGVVDDSPPLAVSNVHAVQV